MYDQQFIRRKSSILTNHSQIRLNTLSVPSLPSLQLSPKHKQKNAAKVYEIKTREQLLKQQRFRNLLKLKINLNQLHIQDLQFKQRMKPKKERDKNMAERMQLVLDQIMAFDTLPDLEIKKEQNIDQIEFHQCCQSLLQICNIIKSQANLHFKNKVQSFAYSMKNQQLLLKIFDKLLQGVSVHKLYNTYMKEFQTSLFKKQLKTLSLQSKYVVQTYQHSRYNFLNADISKRKEKMKQSGKQISDKLNKVQDFKIRKGLFRSLQKMDFQCIANRNLYEELTERVRSINI